VKTISFISILLLFTSNLFAQKAYTKNGSISFFSKSPLENIEAKNNQVMSVLNSQTGEIQFSVIIKAFHFKKALMEEHFNENYMESTKFPKATFKGTITDMAKVNFSKDGSYPVVSSGDFTLHGVTKKITTPGVITIKKGIPSASSKFSVKLKDYGIIVPKLVKDNIAEIIDISVACTYDQKL